MTRRTVQWRGRPLVFTLGFTAAVAALVLLFLIQSRDKGPTSEVDFVTVGDPGNPPDRNGLGSVAYPFRISKYEVTNAQYAVFLDAVAGSDEAGLFHPGMENNPRGGIIRSGQPGGFTYTVKKNMANKPVNFLSFWDRCRYCNWLHNGRPQGAQDASTTEDGAYNLGNLPAIAGNRVTRKPGARFFLPNENEWYKAAYFDPHDESHGGPPGDDHYWLYPTRSDSVPRIAVADEKGNIKNDSENVANFDKGANWNGQDGNVTAVGSGGRGSASYYGVFDLGGNVFEPNETIFGPYRGLRGGAWHITGDRMMSTAHFIYDVYEGKGENERSGFRVAATVESDLDTMDLRALPSFPASVKSDGESSGIFSR